MADQSVRTCRRCGHVHIGIPIQPTALGLFYCARCGTYRLVREMGEMVDPDDRTDDSYGGVGWT